MMQRKFKLAQSENKLLPRFSIRKVGSLTASVLIGISLFGLDNQVQAADLNDNEKTILKQSNSSIYDDMTPITSKYGNTIGQVSKEMNKDNALGIAGSFHIFANEAHLNVDTNGNVAANVVEANVDNGSRGNSQNATKEDIYYIGRFMGNLNAGLGRTSHNHVVVGDDVEVTTKNGQVFLEHDGQETRMDHLNASDIVSENGTKYIDIENELDKLAKKSVLFSSKDSSDDVKSDFSDQNNRYIDVSDAKPNESNHIYVDIPWEYLEAPQPIKIKGLSSLEHAPTVIINVGKGEAKKTAYVQTQVKLNYDGNNQEISNGESHKLPNELLWNFGTELEELNFSSGRFMGSVLAPDATVKANVNVDGNIVADQVYINGGESHRWDLTPSDKIPFFPQYDFSVQPTQPTQPTEPSEKSQPTEEVQPTTPSKKTTPKKPQPTTPTEPEQPTQVSESSQPTEAQPTEPVEPEQPTQASESSQPTEVQPTEPVEPEQPTQASESSQPTEAQPTEPVEPDQPTQASEASNPTAPSEPRNVTPAPSMPTEPSEIPSQPTVPRHEVPVPSEPEKEVSPTQPQNTTPAASTPENPESIAPKNEEEVPEDKDEKVVDTDETSDSPVKLENKAGISPKAEESISVVEEKQGPDSQNKNSTTVKKEIVSSSNSGKNKIAKASVAKVAISKEKTNSVLPETGAKSGMLAIIIGAVSVIIGSITLLFKKKEDK